MADPSAREASEEPAEFRQFRRALEALRLELAPHARGESGASAAEATLVELLEEVRTEVAARRLGFEEETSIAPAVAPLELRFAADTQLDVPPPPFDAYTLGFLLSADGEAFVRHAYRALFHREPDAAGFEAHLDRLCRGESTRLGLLEELRESPEGRKVGARVPGLERALRMQRLSRVPVIGPLLRTVQHLFAAPVISQRLERQQAILFRRERELTRAVRDLARTAEMLRGYQEGMTRELASRRTVALLTQSVAALRNELTELSPKVASQDHIARVVTLAESTLAALRRLEERIGRNAARITEAESASKQISLRGTDDDHALDAFYVAFEDRMRGSTEDIRERVAIYLPVVREARAGGAEAPVLDVGCGRGEWLQLLAQAGLSARGIDTNRVLVERCRNAGLAVEEADAVEYLAALPAESVGAITAIHVIEHIPFRPRMRFLDEALRVLRPGGVIILETPNPENVSVGSCTFWNDPTHVAPLPPDATDTIVQLRGFADTRILRLHPYPAHAHLPRAEAGMRDMLNHRFFGPQDFAIVGYKPAGKA